MKQLSLPSLCVLGSLVLAACSHQAPKTAADPLAQAWRVEDKGPVTTGMPNYILSLEAFMAAGASRDLERAPAGAEAMMKELESQESGQRPSLRRLYFRSLYRQWQGLAAHHGQTNLKSCPQFHHDKLMIDEEKSFGSTGSVALARPVQAELAYYPEWQLPVRAGKSAPIVWMHQGGGEKLMGRALQTHAKKIHRELGKLCEKGASDAYFRLENMVTYYADRPELQAKSGLRALLKIPAFSTMLLMGAMAPEGKDQGLSVHDRNLLKEVRGGQFERYVSELRRHRFRPTTGGI